MPFNKPQIEISNDSGNSVPVVVSNTTTVATALSSLNATLALAIVGHRGVGIQVVNAAVTATLVAEYSFDGGSTWTASAAVLYDPAGGLWALSIAMVASSTNRFYMFNGYPGATHARVRVSAYTSGTMTVTLSATEMTSNMSLISGIDYSTGLPAPVSITSLGSIKTLRESSTACANTSIAAVTTNGTIIASNANRKMLTLYHKAGSTATASVYIKLGAVATLTDYNYELVPGAHLELPLPVYTGQIDGLWDTAGILLASKLYVGEQT